MSGADIVATIDATFTSDAPVSVTLSGDKSVATDLGTVYGSSKVLYNTTEFWNSYPTLISKKGFIYIYSDWRTDSEGKNIAGIKVGDGLAYLIDLPMTDEVWAEHEADVIRHITENERQFWNNKVRCYLDPNDGNHLIFTTN